MTKTKQTYRGDETANVLSDLAFKNIYDALVGVDELLYPETRKQVDAAREAGMPYFENGAKLTSAICEQLIAATICEEADLAGTAHINVQKELERVQHALRGAGYRLYENKYKRQWLAIDVWVVALDQTRNWSIPDEFLGKIERIQGIYFFDRNRIVHCAEFSGSYELNFLENNVVFKEEPAEDLAEKIREYVGEDTSDENVIYVHDSSVDTLIEKNVAWTVDHYGNPGFDLNELDEDVLGDLREAAAKKLTNEDIGPTDSSLLSMVEGDVYDKIMESVRDGLLCNSVL